MLRLWKEPLEGGRTRLSSEWAEGSVMARFLAKYSVEDLARRGLGISEGFSIISCFRLVGA